jgi:predicted Zn-dependent protease
MSNNWVKTESFAEKNKRYKVAFEFWQKHPNLTRIDVCSKFGITESAMRSHMKRYDIKHPRELDNKIEVASSARKKVVRDAYNMALEQDLSAAQAASWATKMHKSKISRAEIQFYATKFDLPYLKEAENFEIGRLCKYA